MLSKYVNYYADLSVLKTVKMLYFIKLVLSPLLKLQNNSKHLNKISQHLRSIDYSTTFEHKQTAYIYKWTSIHVHVYTCTTCSLSCVYILQYWLVIMHVSSKLRNILFATRTTIVSNKTNLYLKLTHSIALSYS